MEIRIKTKFYHDKEDYCNSYYIYFLQIKTKNKWETICSGRLELVYNIYQTICKIYNYKPKELKSNSIFVEQKLNI